MRILLGTLLAAVLVAPLAAPPISVTPATAANLHGTESDSATPQGQVVVISVDGLRSRSLRRLGREGVPNIHRMIHRGVATLNARTVRERTTTLPNHASMMSGRRVAVRRGGHGVGKSSYPAGTTVHDLAGESVASLFDVVREHGGTSALFTGKAKFRLFRDTWRPDGALGHYERRGLTRRLVRRAIRRLVHRTDDLTFLHLRNPDRVGHRKGYASPAYFRAVRRTDAFVGRVMRAIAQTPHLRRSTTVLLTSDHGGRGRHHHDRRLRANYTVPFIAWGREAAKGHNVYRINPDFRGPRRRRTSYATMPPPVRNGHVANLALDSLGLPAVPGSTLDPDQRLKLVP